MSKDFYKNLRVKDVQQYRKWAFPEELAAQNHQPFFQIDVPHVWLQPEPFQLFEQGKTEEYLPDPETLTKVPSDYSIAKLLAYKEFLLPVALQKNAYFSLELVDNWVKSAPYNAFMASRFAPLSPVLSLASPSPGEVKREESPVWIISDDGDVQQHGRNLPEMQLRGSGRQSSPFYLDTSPLPPVNKKRLREYSSSEYQPDSSSQNSHSSANTKGQTSSSCPSTPSAPAAKVRRTNNGPLVINRKTSLPRIIEIDDIPKVWNIPRDGAGYVFSFEGKKDAFDKFVKTNGEQMSMDAIIRAESTESWGGSTGARNGNTTVNHVFGPVPVPARRVELKCNGMDVCDNFDSDVLEGYERYEGNEEERDVLLKRFQEQCVNEAKSPITVLARFYNIVKSAKCPKSGCTGTGIIKLRNRGESREGQQFFIGCSQWKKKEEFEHLYMDIPQNVNEYELRAALQSGRVLGDVTFQATCVQTRHPRMGSNQKFCHFTHIVNGKIIQPGFRNRKCPTVLRIYVPLNPNILKALLIFQNPHNHPVYPKDKFTPTQAQHFQSVIEAAGPMPMAAQKLTQVQTTRLVLNGKPFQEVFPGLVNTRRLRNVVKTVNVSRYSEGMGWEGVKAEFMKELSLPLAERYIHSFIAHPDFHVAVTMHSGIIKYIHEQTYLVVDFTFKPIIGRTNRWHVAGFVESIGERIILASVYSDAATRDAYFYLWHEFFEVVKKVTGKQLHIKVFHPEGNLRAIIMDGEAAQVQAFGDYLAVTNDSTISGIQTKDPLELVLYILKTCITHYNRNIDEIDKSVSKEEIQRLKSFPSLTGDDAIQKWHETCRKTPYKAVHDWYNHKRMHPWFLGTVNAFLSRLPVEHWNTTPNHSNLVETAHAGRNAETGINLPVLSAMIAARIRDKEKAAQLQHTESTGIFRNNHNLPFERERRAAQRRSRAYTSSAKRTGQVNRFLELQNARQSYLEEKQTSLARQHDIDTRLDELKAATGTPSCTLEMSQLVEERSMGIQQRKELDIQRKTLNEELRALREGPLKGARLQGIRPRDIATPSITAGIPVLEKENYPAQELAAQSASQQSPMSLTGRNARDIACTYDEPCPSQLANLTQITTGSFENIPEQSAVQPEPLAAPLRVNIPAVTDQDVHQSSQYVHPMCEEFFNNPIIQGFMKKHGLDD